MRPPQKLPDKKSFTQVRNRFALRRRSLLASLATGEDKNSHMLMVLGLIKNRFDGT